MGQKLIAAFTSVGTAFFLMLLKLTVGLLSGSLGILAEATNSALDIMASLVTVIAIYYADRPADETHHYGHGKAENLGALVQSAILLLTCGWIGWEALRRLLIEPTLVRPTIWAFAVMIISVVVSLSRVRSLSSAAQEHGSQALEADALHFYTDIYTGAAVIVGLLGVWVSEHFSLPFLARADALAALIVVGILGQMTLRLAKHAVDVLLDRSHEQTNEIFKAARGVPGVLRVASIRTRQVGPQSFVDMSIDVARTSSFEQSHAIASAVEQAVHKLLPRLHIVVHAEPVQPADESLVQAIHLLAQREGLAIHHISLHHVTGRMMAYLHLELESQLTLIEAHKRADAFERLLCRSLPELTEVISHLEPMNEEVAAGPDVTIRAKSLLALIERLANEFPEIYNCHDITVQKVGPKYNISLHCTFDPESNLQQVHDIMASLERRLRHELPVLQTIVIHPEPFSADE